MIEKNISLKEKIAAEQFTKEKNYWLEKLSGDPAACHFPYGFKNNGKEHPMIEPGSGSIHFKFPAELFSRLMKLTNGSDYKLHMVLVTALIILLKKYTGVNDIIIGTPIYKQEAEGKFVNTVLALRNIIDDGITFKDLLLQVRQSIKEASENQNYPMETLLYQLNMPATENSFPLFDVAILLENIHNRTYIQHITTNMTFSLTRTDEFIEGLVDYNSSLYEGAAVEKITGHFTRLLGNALQDANRNIPGIEILSEEEREQLLVEFNNTLEEYPQDKAINELFEEQVEITAGHIAVVFEEMHLTYRQLNEKANQLARVLRARGIKINTVVGIMLESSLEMVIAMMAILKAGGVYLPIDIEYPGERIKYMIEDSGTKILLSQECIIRENDPLLEDVLVVDDGGIYAGGASNLDISICPYDPAYILYTSGSTGKPKGVIVEHGSVINVVKWFGKRYQLSGAAHILGLTNYTFDPNVEDVYGALLHGAAVYMVEYDLLASKEDFRDYIAAKQIDLVDYVPAVLNQLLGYDRKLESLKVVISGGEKLEETVKNRLIGKGYNLYNNYGPTEITVDALSSKCSHEPVNLGKPIANTRCYILDPRDNLLPIGACGQLCIAGPGVAKGYLNNPGLTAEKFTADPFAKGGKMYRTGDLARWLPDGNIEFSGRWDRQIKVRGFRVELGEIESRLMNHDGIKEAAVIAVEDDWQDKYLCAYIVPDREFAAAELREYLLTCLPDHMVPLYYVPLEKIPLFSNGKVDRNALPGPGALEPAQDYTAPRDHVEKKLVDIWSDVLAVEKNSIGIDADFFMLGGHSVKTISMLSKIHKQLNAKASFGEIFKNSTIRELAAYIKGLPENKFIPIEPSKSKDHYVLSSAQKRLFILQQMDLQSMAYNLPQVFILEGKNKKDKLEETFKKLIKRHESLRTSFEIIDGESFQKIHKDTPFAIEYYDLDADPGGWGEEEIIKNFIRPFDLSRPPLLRVGLIKTGTARHIMMIDMHHIITDAVSQGIFVKDFCNLYRGEELPGLKVQYKDFAEWQNSEEEKKTVKKQEDFWLSMLAGDIPVLNLATDYERPPVQSFEGSRVRYNIGKEKTTALRKMALEEGTTLFTLLLTIFNILLAKLCSQEDIIIGSDTAGRRHKDLEHIMGIFVNTIVLRNYPEGKKNFIDFLREVKEKTMQAFENQDYPFEDLVDKVVKKRDAGRNPLFDIIFTLDNAGEQPGDTPELELSEFRLAPYKYESQSAKFDLTWFVTELGDELACTVEYCTKLFKKETIEQFIDYFKEIISAVIKDRDIQLKDITISHRLLYAQPNASPLDFGF